MNPLQDDEDYKSALAFVLYHLIYSSDSDVRAYEGHSFEEWERYQSKTSARLVERIVDFLTWAVSRPEEDFEAIVRPATDLKSETLYNYIVKFRESVIEHTGPSLSGIS